MGLGILLLGVAAMADQKTKIKVPLRVESRWVRLSSTSAVLVEKTPAAPEYPTLKGLLREFELVQREVLLGEPLLVEYRVTSSSRTWKEPVGGRYRGSGRDDNFLFLMRHQDGEWLADPYGRVFDLGGLSTSSEVGPTNSFHYWLPVHRWCRPEKVGKYRLYCLRRHSYKEPLGRKEAINAGLPAPWRFDPSKGLVDQNGETSTSHFLEIDFQSEPHPHTPILLSDELKAELARRQVDGSDVAVLGSFEVVVSKGTEAERKAAAAHWQRLAERPQKRWPDNRAAAARMGVWFAANPLFLPCLEEWLPQADSNELTGLAVGEEEQVKLLLEAPPNNALGALYRVRPPYREWVRPWLEAQGSEQARSILESWNR